MSHLHADIFTRLDDFITTKQIPNILLHGPSGSGKRTIMTSFIDNVYSAFDDKNQLVMWVECGHGKGIKCIREQVNYFAKTNCHNTIFKSIILLNADKLTGDAQSALRRSIELFSNTTRFFLILQDKNRLLHPLLSRFCILFVPVPVVEKTTVSLHDFNKSNYIKQLYKKKDVLIKKVFADLHSPPQFTHTICIDAVELLYNKGCSGHDIIIYMQNHDFDAHILLAINKLGHQIKSEKILMFSILQCAFFLSTDQITSILDC
tara:strand:+ start:99 stop:884 length:786 start_codon:yes stop_codon:yes gene_type:complete